MKKISSFFENITNDEDKLQALICPRNLAFGVNDLGQMKLCELLDVDYLQPLRNSSNKANLLKNSHLMRPGIKIKIHANWFRKTEEIFWVRISKIKTLVTGEQIFYAQLEHDAEYLPVGTGLGPIRLCNIYDVDFEGAHEANHFDNVSTAVN
ncbi:hypothetical protein [Polynucleobacter yangtzensis]|uniref:hypothetical protein n=1 Tax=Polynucleobacter yangtzensis TaxID=1743159 RepID=UPI0008302B4D|nr:hypothetical protein [Polynucleobacter yangtzensis]